MFWIRYTTRDGSGNETTNETQLAISPGEIDYPDARYYSTMMTQDRAVVIQRPMCDDRARKWIWRGYGPTHATYATQWTLLESLDARTRHDARLTPSIGIWEDVSGTGGFDRRNLDGSRLYTNVRLVQVTRSPRTSGPVHYESSVTFHIDDTSYAGF